MQRRSWKASKSSTRNLSASGEEETRRPINIERARERTFQRAVKLLAAKPRSVAELRERLLEKPWTNAEIVEIALTKLQEYGYLNDERFAYGYASARVRQKPVGRGRLARDLQMKKIARETADEALALVYQETPEEELIERALQKRLRLRGRPTTRAESKSLFDHLLRQGFAADLVIKKVRAAATDNTDLDEQEE